MFVITDIFGMFVLYKKHLQEKAAANIIT